MDIQLGDGPVKRGLERLAGKLKKDEKENDRNNSNSILTDAFDGANQVAQIPTGTGDGSQSGSQQGAGGSGNAGLPTGFDFSEVPANVAQIWKDENDRISKLSKEEQIAHWLSQHQIAMDAANKAGARDFTSAQEVAAAVGPWILRANFAASRLRANDYPMDDWYLDIRQRP
jgi:hypothetical protein